MGKWKGKKKKTESGREKEQKREGLCRCEQLTQQNVHCKKKNKKMKKKTATHRGKRQRL